MAGEALTEIEALELKSGKVNYIFRYKTVYFTVFWDSVLKRIIFLNEVSKASRTEFTAVKNNEFFIKGLEYIAGLHPNELKNYKTLSTGESMNGLYIVFQIEFLSGSKKYRCIFQVNKENMDVAEIIFIELIEVSLRESNLKEIKILTEQYQIIDSNNFKTDRYFIMVDQYIKNRNQVLLNAKILGAGSKPQNLGFSYKVTYKTEDSKIMEVEVYIETFSQKYSQTYIK